MVDVEDILKAMRNDGYYIEMFSTFDVVGLPWTKSDERRVWVALVDAAMNVTRAAVRRADDETFRIVLEETLPETTAPLRLRTPSSGYGDQTPSQDDRHKRVSLPNPGATL